MAKSKDTTNKHPYRAPKAYRNEDFLASPDARALRILAEYLEPMERFEHYDIRDTVLFFGSARLIAEDEAKAGLAAAEAADEGIELAQRRLQMSRYYEATRELARRITEWSKGLKDPARRFVVCSGGGPGIMEAANRGASEAKGDNIGLGISLPFEQSGNDFITHRLAFEFHYFFMRKFWFLYMAKAMVIMPGGFGTLDELFETLTLIQTRKIAPVPVVLVGEDYWRRAFDVDFLVDEGVIEEEDRELFWYAESAPEIWRGILGWYEASGTPLLPSGAPEGGGG